MLKKCDNRSKGANNKQMLFNFDIHKAIAAASHLIERKGGAEDMFVLIKKLYYADRSALIKWGRPITGDSFASMDKGPIVSTIYDLLKGSGSQRNLIQWEDVIFRNPGFKISLRKQADSGPLSEREIEILDQTSEIIDNIRGSIPKWLHKNCPEWTDPHGSSIPIDPSQILRIAKKSEDEIQRTEKASEEIRFMNYLLGPN
jgi:hypothetical protein